MSNALNIGALHIYAFHKQKETVSLDEHIIRHKAGLKAMLSSSSLIDKSERYSYSACEHWQNYVLLLNHVMR
jgi:hypothetical protein